MFKGKINKSHIDSILDAVTGLVDECRVVVYPNGLKVRGTDQSDVATLLIDVSKDAFEDEEFQQGSVCWDFSQLEKMMNTVNEEAEVNLEIQTERGELDIRVLDLNYKLSLLDPESLKRDRSLPKIDLPAEVVLDDSSFERGINASDLVADHVEFGINEQESSFYMEAKGDTNRVILEKRKQNLSTFTLEPVSATYNVDYLKHICKAIPRGTDIRIKWDEDKPMRISFDIIDNKCEVTYFLAPRIEPDT